MIYISGPISGDPNYLKKFANAEHYLASHYSGNVINPASVLSRLPLPELEYKDLMRLCLDLLSMCDSICMLQGWRESRGAVLEYHYAVTHDFRIIFQD